jgi:parallel beta-helix repeat protein
MTIRPLCLLSIILLQAMPLPVPACGEELPPPLVITESTKLDPKKTYSRIVIKASDITIDGQGAWLIGATAGKPKDFKGTAIEADGADGVTLKNVNAKGFETGLRVSNASRWTIENCNFSDNFHDPDFGWGENGRRGGIVLTNVSRSHIKGNKANRVWDACVLVNSDRNTIEKNDFSKTSNTCLKLWTSSNNWIHGNNLSYGLRISPGEVHARDSTSVLIESGSNSNYFNANDCTHGGDGIFIRVLNGWVSTKNIFTHNDCSYANNNGFECWAPGNSFYSNKANHCSYGFWMGGSDRTVLEANQANFNGDPKGFHNSPHLPKDGHAGIVFMFGPGSHCVARGNTCIGNNGAGIAVIGDQESKGAKWKAFHWIIEQNKLEQNRWGVFLQYADWIDIAANTHKDNGEDVHDAGGVTRLTTRKFDGEPGDVPKIKLVAPSSAIAGEQVNFALARAAEAPAPMETLWDFGDGTTSKAESLTHAFKQPGFYRVGVSITNGQLSNLAWRDFYVVADIPEPATEGAAKQWSLVEEPNLKMTFADDAGTKLAGKSSVAVKINPYHGQRASMLYPKTKDAGWKLGGKKKLVFWLKTQNPNLPGWQDVNPVVTLYESDKRSLKLTPKADLLGQPSYNEAREGWKYFEVPLGGNEQWAREGEIATLNWLTIGVDSWGHDALQLWIDGLGLE